MKWMVIALLTLMLLTSCGEDRKKDPARDANVADSGSVYDNGSGGVNTDAEDIREDPEDFTAYVPEEDIGSAEIGVLDPNDPANLSLNWAPVLFEFDQASLTEGARKRLEDYARILRNHTDKTVLLEGHCDMRGTENYNLALGERRAQAVKRFFMSLGVDAAQLRTISYGELRPIDRANNEQAWARNRRVAFTF